MGLHSLKTFFRLLIWMAPLQEIRKQANFAWKMFPGPSVGKKLGRAHQYSCFVWTHKNKNAGTSSGILKLFVSIRIVFTLDLVFCAIFQRWLCHLPAKHLKRAPQGNEIESDINATANIVSTKFYCELSSIIKHFHRPYSSYFEQMRQKT